MTGNVWEWTADRYSPRLDPAQPQFAVPRKVVKGGSFLCADIDTGMSHVGFRCARDSG